MSSKPQFEEVEATVIEPQETALARIEVPLFAISVPKAGAIVSNLAEIDATVDAIVAEFAGVEFDDEDVKVAKSIRAALNKVDKALDDSKKDAKRKAMEQYNIFEDALKATRAKIAPVVANIDSQVKAAEQRAKDARFLTLCEYYETLADLLAPIVPFERLCKPEWLNATFGEVKAQRELDDIVRKIDTDWTALKQQSATMKHYEAAEAVFFRSLDLAAALAESGRIDAEEAARVAELERIAAMKAEVERYKPQTVAEVVADVAKAYGHKVGAEPAETWVAVIDAQRVRLASKEAALELAEVLKKYDIHGRITHE